MEGECPRPHSRLCLVISRNLTIDQEVMVMDRKLVHDDLKDATARAGTAVQRIPTHVYPYAAGLSGGLLGGLAMVGVALAYGLLSGRGVWFPVNLIAATLLRGMQTTPLEGLMTFSLAGLVVGLFIHLAMCMGLGLVFATLLPTLPGSPVLWAFIIGPILWAGAIFAGLPLVDPVMAQHVDWLSFAVANIAYSLVLGLWVRRSPKIRV